MKNKKKNPQFFVFADCETNPFEKGVTVYKPFIFGAVIYSTDFQLLKYETFTTADEFINRFENTDCVIYFHNGGKFDFLFFKKFFTGNILFINGRIAQFQVGKAIFRDSYLYIPLPLASYRKDSFDYQKLYNFKKYQAEILQYLKDDCIFLSEIMIHFLKTFGNNLTIASSCLEYFVKSEKITKHQYKTKSEKYDSIFRDYYFGGRVEVFKSGITRGVRCYDINSAYPFAMLKNHPWGYSFITSNCEDDILPHSFVKCEGVSLGAFPFREENGVNYPRDRIPRVYNVTGWEFLTAKELGAFNGKVLEVRTHVSTRNFQNYILHFYGMKERAEKKSPDYLLAKLAMNSLYGKFGQNPREFKETQIIEYQEFAESYEIDGKKFIPVSIIDSERLIAQCPNDKLTFLNVAISASITGCQRAYLFRHLWNSEKPIYCDTDSIICKDLKSKDLHPKKLGFWDIEAEFSRIWIGGKKLYCGFDSDGKLIKYASKGARLEADDFEKLMTTGKVVWENDKPTFHAKGKTECDFMERMIQQNVKRNVGIRNFENFD